MNGVEEDVKCCRPTGDERVPPPLVVLKQQKQIPPLFQLRICLIPRLRNERDCARNQFNHEYLNDCYALEAHEVGVYPLHTRCEYLLKATHLFGCAENDNNMHGGRVGVGTHFSAELEVADEDGSFCRAHQQHCEDNEEETEHKEELMTPDAIEDEEELYEDAPKRKETAKKNRRCQPHVPGLPGHLPRYLIGLCRHIYRLKRIKNDAIKRMYTRTLL